MAEIVIELQYKMEEGLCYYLSGTANSMGGGDQADFELGDGTTYDSIGTVTADGGFSFLFTYDGSPAYSFLRITITAYTFTIDDLQLRLQQACTEKVCSECYKLDDCEPPHREHLKLQWTNREDGLGFSYSTPFTHTLYIIGGLRNADYPYEEDIFTTSDRQTFPVYTAAVKTKELWIHDLPEYIHDALRIGLVHDYFYINDVRYVKNEGSYSPDWDTPNSLLAPCVVKVQEFQQDTVNDNCI